MPLLAVGSGVRVPLPDEFEFDDHLRHLRCAAARTGRASAHWRESSSLPNAFLTRIVVESYRVELSSS